MPLSLGDQLGPYKIQSLLGKGGMGEVYRATDTQLKRDVALKVLPAAFANDPERLGRFQREAEVLASLDHPSIAPIFGMVESNGERALALALIEGPTLADRIAQGPMPIEEAIEIAKQIVAALEYAHERNVIHRDLKPANIKITLDGAVKVLDFGLAKVLDDELQATSGLDSPTLTIGHTRAGVILGTAAYMSPEQAVGKPADRRSDIFSFGSVLYEMLTGERAFSGDSAGETLVAVAKDEPSWSKLPLLPSNVDKALRRCLIKDRKLRLQAIGEARILLETPEVPVRPVTTARPWSTHSYAPWAVAALIALALTPANILHFREQPPVAATVRFQIPAPEKTAFTLTHAPVISPDGKRLIFGASTANGQTQLWVRSLDTLDARPLAGTDGANAYYFWSPDSKFVAFDQGGKLRKVDASGGPPQTICDLPGASRSGAWSSEGVIIFGSPASGIWRVSEAGGAPSQLTKQDPSRGENYNGHPAFLPGGRRFIYLRSAPSNSDVRGIYLGSLDLRPEQQSSKRLLATEGNAVYAPSADPDIGYLLFLREGSLMAQRFDARRVDLAGEAFPIAEGVGATFQKGFFSASSAGALAYRTGASAAGGNQLIWFDRTGKNLGTVWDRGQYSTISLSPDGNRVAVERTDQSNIDVWVFDLTRNTPTRLTFDLNRDGWPTWSPDGTHVAFSAIRMGVPDLYRKEASGAGSDELLFKSGEVKQLQDWSRDGRLLMYSQQSKGGNDLWVLPLDGPGGAPKSPMPYIKTEFDEGGGRFSPDGNLVAYSSNQSGGVHEVYVQPFPDPSKGKWQISRGGGAHPRWRRDGKELFYISADSKMMAVDVSLSPAFKPGVPHALFQTAILGAAQVVNETRYDVTADGQKFLINTLANSDASGAPSPSISVVLNWQAGLK